MLRIGITGGMGSGKSTICRVWKGLGAYIIDADELAKTIMIEHQSVIASIKETFGASAYLPDGSLNRAFLAEKAFLEGKVESLNAIVHPEVFKESDILMNRAANKGYKMAVREAAILLQYGKPRDLDAVVLVLSEANARCNRVIQRDQAQKSTVLARMAHQPDYETYLPIVDYVVYNHGTLEELELKAQTLFKELLELDKNGIVIE